MTALELWFKIQVERLLKGLPKDVFPVSLPKTQPRLASTGSGSDFIDLRNQHSGRLRAFWYRRPQLQRKPLSTGSTCCMDVHDEQIE